MEPSAGWRGHPAVLGLVVGLAASCAAWNGPSARAAGGDVLRRTDHPTEELTARVADDALDGSLDRHALLEAALAYRSAAVSENVLLLGAAYERWCAGVVERAGRLAGRRNQARYLLHRLHDRWCGGRFDAPCARIDETLQRGRYNCVTTVILFHVLARRMGWETRTVSVPGHVFVRIAGTPSFDVQTTCRTWLDEGAARPVVPGGAERLLSDVQLLAKLHYNAGVIELSRGRYADAARSFHHALVWDPQDRSAAQNLVASYNNGALRLCQGGRYAAAIASIERAVRIDPQLEMLRANEVYIYHQWLGHLRATGRHVAAEALQQHLEHHAREYLRERRWLPSRRQTAGVSPPE